MRKLSLDLNEIRVESFATSRTTDPAGTVHAHETEARPTPCISCRDTCADTCGCPPFSDACETTDPTWTGDWYPSCPFSCYATCTC